jgi:hypothetical protein
VTGTNLLDFSRWINQKDGFWANAAMTSEGEHFSL